MPINPFFELYAGDRLSSDEFVELFSPFLVPYSEALFLPGNVVVKGVQGSGKSMLLSLLKSDVRRRYACVPEKFPVRKEIRNFIGAGINLTQSNAIDFGYRSISDDPNETALYFADFVNYTVLLDLLRSIRTLSNPVDVVEDLQINLSASTESTFVRALAASDIFESSLRGCTSIDDVLGCIRSRLNSYRRFLHKNDRCLDPIIRESKTDMGSTISEAVQVLKDSQVIDPSVVVFIHIDQYEELVNISSEEKHSPDYRRVINRALARRDPTVSYRIGTRGHAWRNHGYIFGTEAKLEEERDYKFLDLDFILKRHENRKTWVFPRFAEDVFARRLQYARLAPKSSSRRDFLRLVFGPGLAPKEKALKHAGSTNRGRSVKVDPEWPITFQTDIKQLAQEDPLAARLLEAWVLQQLGRTARAGMKRLRPVDLDLSMLSSMESGRWWRKERVELALVQIAGRCAQRPLWSGALDIIDLSGGNILTFLSICQFIWDTQKQVGKKNRFDNELFGIDVDVQAIGVFKASDHWLRKITQETGRSGDRYRLAKHIGYLVNRDLYNDRKMSYPGHNGFSLADEDLHRFPHVKEILDEMSDHGTILAGAHTTKTKDRRPRHKFYLSPILCPQFRIPYKRLKEPRYIHPSEVEHWMHEAKVKLPDSYQPRKHRVTSFTQASLPLFEDLEDL